MHKDTIYWWMCFFSGWHSVDHWWLLRFTSLLLSYSTHPWILSCGIFYLAKVESIWSLGPLWIWVFPSFLSIPLLADVFNVIFPWFLVWPSAPSHTQKEKKRFSFTSIQILILSLVFERWLLKFEKVNFLLKKITFSIVIFGTQDSRLNHNWKKKK